MYKLFNHTHEIAIDLISIDGKSRYFGQIFSNEIADTYFHKFLSGIAWKNDEIIVFGKRYITSRKSAWYGEMNTDYEYAGVNHKPLFWTNELLEIKTLIEKLTDANYNSCLLNLYHNGNEGMGWHRDNEKEIMPNSTIASLSFGAERKFKFKNISNKQVIEINLQHGSLLTMEGSIQNHWMHCLPKTKKINHPRINLTFRQIMQTT